jgi:thiol-disulfide isomerase/thioredoxin
MKLLVLAFLSCLFSIAVAAQATTNTVVKRRLEDLNVKDSSGTFYPTSAVQVLLSSGKFGLRPILGSNDAIIYPLSETEQINRALRAPKPRESSSFAEGKAIASFKEWDMKGNKYSLKELAGKVVVMNFWFINCPPCRQEIPELNEIVNAYKDTKDVVFLAVALDDKRDLEEFLATTPYLYNIVHNGKSLAEKYRINSYPTHVVLDKEGKVIFHTSGYGPGMTAPWIKKSIEAGLNNTALK